MTESKNIFVYQLFKEDPYLLQVGDEFEQNSAT